ncbi:hypothetical protein TIFTF001_040878 [Ficus carica]|uniref:Uncharacterized protein n=1 Tax=Ficus carica TaxID=3494 RepID=A0AA87YYF7_FICCA|nr:hypothetical protein TIFTF001_040865 [Ficus carica]GMN26534.1 hypothetical protein TIFTF001_040869 [Ficus carica]GMN26572.1 hypothetical protein TIFTF001_040874 [Ficus carica]GMN26582.1 hypothetical protein TIFTF001_040878 [Ficus carica]
MDADRDDASVFYEMQPLLFDGTRQTIALAGWLHDMESIFRIGHIEAYLQVPLARRCLVAGARIWWMIVGEPAIPNGTWADFRVLIIARYGLVLNEDAYMLYRDLEIYRDMYYRRYLSYAADWHAYPNESMGHYCQRFRDAMLPYIHRNSGDPELQALHLLMGGLPPNVRLFVLEPMAGMTVEEMIHDIMEAEIMAHMMQVADLEDDYAVPVDDASIAEPLFHGGPVLPEDPIPAMPLQVIPPQEAEADVNDGDMDPVDVSIDQEEDPDDPPIVIIESDDEEDVQEEQEKWEEHEGNIEEEWEGLEEPEEDPDKILFDDGDWDADSDISSDITTE